MTVRVLVNGARGKMGSLACQTLENHPDFELVAGLSRQDNLSAAIQKTKAHVVVDLTRADVVYENSLTIINHGAHPVIGTSGLLDNEIQHLNTLCMEKKLGGIIVPNFSLGAVLMMRFSAIAATFLPDAEIIETHHPDKYDAPSGTAMKTADIIATARKEKGVQTSSHELIPGARGARHHEIAIHSLRLPGVLARQQVVFGNTGETLSITHDSIDRKSFMPGVVLCCKKVGALEGMHYGLESLLGI